MASTEDGNCLFKTASLVVCQNENLAFELHLRTCFELARNREFYRNHPLLVNAKIPYVQRKGPGSVMSVESLCVLCCFPSSSSDVHLKQGFEAACNCEIMRTAIIDKDCIHTTELCKSWPWQVFLKFQFRLYTLIRTINYCLFTRTFLSLDRSLTLQTLQLWQSRGPVQNGWPDRSKEFAVNHFVPLFKQSDKVFLTQGTATVTTWGTFHSTKKPVQDFGILAGQMEWVPELVNYVRRPSGHAGLFENGGLF